jgi:GT2 family glycosyltransferase
MPGLPQLDIVIVNWNAGALLRDCLRSIASAQRDGFRLRRVIIVDNASSDGSTDAAIAPYIELARADSAGLRIEVARNSQNLGFARACNQGAALAWPAAPTAAPPPAAANQGASADYLLFLNPDARLFGASLSQPIEFMEAPGNESVGICGIQLVGDDGSVSRSCARAPTPASMAAGALALDRLCPGRFPAFLMREWDHGADRDVDHVIGAFYLIRQKAFAALGGFDERFFVYLEDLDLSIRARKVGWRCRFLAGAQAYHKGGGVSEKAKASRLAYSLESRLRYCFKHFSALQAMAIAALTLAIEPGMRLGLAARERSASRLAETVFGYARLARSLAGLGPRLPCRPASQASSGIGPGAGGGEA